MPKLHTFEGKEDKEIFTSEASERERTTNLLSCRKELSLCTPLSLEAITGINMKHVECLTESITSDKRH